MAMQFKHFYKITETRIGGEIKYRVDETARGKTIGISHHNSKEDASEAIKRYEAADARRRSNS
jgi:hypothetical protein